MCCPTDCVSRTANVGTVGMNGLRTFFPLLAGLVRLPPGQRDARQDPAQRQRFGVPAPPPRQDGQGVHRGNEAND